VRLRWGALSGWSHTRLRDELAKLPDEDHTAAAYQHFSRKRPELREEVPQPGIAAFFLACREGGGLADRFKLSIKRLHSAKDRMYGRAWKRRGERISMLPNIARKVDRLEEYAKAGRSLSDESALDTAVDLYVYVAKYRLWLAEHQAQGMYVGVQAPTPLSEHDANVDTLVDRLSLERSGETKAFIAAIGADFETLWRAAEAGGAPSSRIGLADALLKSSESLVAALFVEHPALVVRFIGQEVTA
jgi:thymidylate synthase